MSVVHSSIIRLNTASGSFKGEGSDSFDIKKSGLPLISGSDENSLNGKFMPGEHRVPAVVVNHGTWTIPGVGSGNIVGRLTRIETPDGPTLAGQFRLEFGKP